MEETWVANMTQIDAGSRSTETLFSEYNKKQGEKERKLTEDELEHYNLTLKI